MDCCKHVLSRAIILALIVSPIQVFAELAPAETGTLIPGREQTATKQKSGRVSTNPRTKFQPQPDDEAIRVGRAMASCAVKQDIPRVENALRQIGSWKVYEKAVKKLQPTLSRCIGKQLPNAASRNQLRMGGMFHGLLAEAWILQFGLENLGLTPVQPADIADKMTKETAANKILLSLAWCLVRTRPNEITKLLTAVPGTQAESAAFKNVSPFISSCLPSHVTFRTEIATLRWELASVAYTIQREEVEDRTKAAKNATP